MAFKWHFAATASGIGLRYVFVKRVDHQEKPIFEGLHRGKTVLGFQLLRLYFQLFGLLFQLLGRFLLLFTLKL